MEPEADGLKCMDVACNPQRIAGRCGKAQMMPYWASSCSSRWLKASQGQMTVISTTQSQMWLNRLLRARQACLKCFSRSVVYLPVPKPSIPGMSSPKLQRQRDYKACLVIRCKALQTDRDADIPLDALLWRLALELTGLPLLEFGWALAWGGGASADTGGGLDLSFGLKIHVEQLGYECGGCWLLIHLSDVWSSSWWYLSKNKIKKMSLACLLTLPWTILQHRITLDELFNHTFPHMNTVNGLCHLCVTLQALILFLMWQAPDWIYTHISSWVCVSDGLPYRTFDEDDPIFHIIPGSS